MAASATFALKAGVWFRRGRLLMVSPDSRGTACPPSGRSSTYRPVQISGTGSVVAEETRSIDLRTLHVKIGASGRLGFVSPDIVREILGVEPGALTPLALMHDRNHATTVVLDGKIMNDSQLNFHPLVNTESIGLAPIQLMQFITATRHQYIVVELDT